ncbi:MAG TPA: hypothetical protein VGE28_06370 [Pseudomonas sp.]
MSLQRSMILALITLQRFVRFPIRGALIPSDMRRATILSVRQSAFVQPGGRTVP